MTRKPFRREPRFVQMIAVHVHGIHGLIDMLRYDSCFPSSEIESRKLTKLIDHASEPSDHILRLTRVARNDLPPTDQRWRSFGCTVLDYRSPDDEPISDTDLAERAKSIAPTPKAVRS